MATARKTKSDPKPPWDRENPKRKTGAKTKHLSASDKASAERSAKKAGRPYPNLVDNMRAAKADKAANKASN